LPADHLLLDGAHFHWFRTPFAASRLRSHLVSVDKRAFAVTRRVLFALHAINRPRSNKTFRFAYAARNAVLRGT